MCGATFARWTWSRGLVDSTAALQISSSRSSKGGSSSARCAKLGTDRNSSALVYEFVAELQPCDTHRDAAHAGVKGEEES